MGPPALNVCQNNGNIGTFGKSIFVLHRRIWSQSKFLHKKLFLELTKPFWQTDGFNLSYNKSTLKTWNIKALSQLIKLLWMITWVAFFFVTLYCFDRCSSELAELVPLLYSWGRSTCYRDWLHDRLSPVLDVTRMSMWTVSFFAELEWNSLPV